MTQLTEEQLINIRRDLHKIPEIGLQEEKTAQYILAFVDALKSDKLEVKVQDTAITVLVKGKKGTKTIGWRTDIDALPITEDTNYDFSSTHEGKMHACGHDFHMTIALGALKDVVDAELDNDVLFFFQPAEENESGAKIYTDNGFLDVSKIDEFYGLHVKPDLPVGTISTRVGTLFAGACRIDVTFHGKESHAAYPHLGNDMIIAASSFIQQSQTIVSRNVNPTDCAVLTFGELNAGVADNVVAGKAVLTGTIRSFTYEINDLVVDRLKSIAKGIEASFDCKIDITFDQQGYVAGINSEDTTEYLMDYLDNLPEITLVDAGQSMGAEDFGYLLKQTKGTMFWLGVDSDYGLHHSKFNPKEEALVVGRDTVSGFIKALDQDV